MTTRILCLTQYDESVASSRVRVYQFLPALRRKGYEVDVRPLLAADARKLLERLATSRKPWELTGIFFRLGLRILGRIGDVLSARKYDLVLVQKDVLPFGLLWLLRLAGRPMIFDFDDPIWLGHPASGEQFVVGRWLRDYRSHCWRAMLRASSAVLTDNELLADVAKSHGAPVEVLCSPIRTDEYRYREPDAKLPEEAVIGWIGSPSTSYLLEALLPSLEKLNAKRRIRLLNVGGLPLKSAAFAIENIGWSSQSEAQSLSRMHVGLMPTDERPFNKFRFGYKVVIYFCAGVPTLAADAALNPKMISDGSTGLLYRPDDAEDFAAKGAKLLSSTKLRLDIAKRARAEAEDVYEVERLAPRLIGIIEGVIERMRGGAASGVPEIRPPRVAGSRKSAAR